MNPFLQIGSAILGIQIAATTIKFLFGLFAFDVPAPEGWIWIYNFRMIGPRSGLNTTIRNPYKMYYSLYSLTKFFLTMLVASYKEKKKVTRGQDPDLIFLQGRIRIRLFLSSDPDFLGGRSRIRSSQSEFATILWTSFSMKWFCYLRKKCFLAFLYIARLPGYRYLITWFLIKGCMPI